MHEKPLNTHPSRLTDPRNGGVNQPIASAHGHPDGGRLPDRTPDHADVGRIRRSGRAAQRCVGRLLVHVLPPPPGFRRGARALIAAAGGGLVEAYPHDLPEGKKTSASFLYNATRTMYERLGFSYDRSKGKGNCVMSAVVPAATS